MTNTIHSCGRVIILSPHLDDAGLSVPAFVKHLLKSKKQILCANCFTISPYAPGLNSKNIKKISAARKAEDLRALRYLGKMIKTKNLDFPDAPLRGISNVTGANHIGPAEEEIIRKLMRFILRYNDSLIVAPLGILHIDHITVSESVLRLITSGLLSSRQVIFYEELPVSGTRPLGTIGLRIRKIQKRLRIKMIKKNIKSSNLLALKKKMICFYPSQLGEADIGAVMRHIKRRGNREVCWALQSCKPCPHRVRLYNLLSVL